MEGQQIVEGLSRINAIEKIAHDTAEMVQDAYELSTAEVVKFTPSINAGRRYVGLKIDGREFLIMIEVKEA